MSVRGFSGMVGLERDGGTGGCSTERVYGDGADGRDGDHYDGYARGDEGKCECCESEVDSCVGDSVHTAVSTPRIEQVAASHVPSSPANASSVAGTLMPEPRRNERVGESARTRTKFSTQDIAKAANTVARS